MLIANWKISVVLFDDENTENFKFVDDTAFKVRDPLYLAVSDPEIAAYYNVSIPALVLLKTFDEKRNDF